MESEESVEIVREEEKEENVLKEFSQIRIKDDDD